MPTYQYRCPEKHVTETTHPIGQQPTNTECNKCAHTASRVYNNPQVQYDGGQQNFHDNPSLTAQRKTAHHQLQQFCNKSKKHGGVGYHPDEFQLANSKPVK